MLCFSCHNKKIKTADNRVISNIEKLVRSSAYIHVPVAENECAVCHLPHESEYHALLSAEYPQTTYLPFVSENYELCWQCHDSAMLESKSAADDTAFRNGDRNLHSLHVNKDKGRTCRMCHNPHAASQPMLINPFVPFGKWRMPVQYMQTSTGGRCAPGCHREFRYDRENPVQYNVKTSGEQ